MSYIDEESIYSKCRLSNEVVNGHRKRVTGVRSRPSHHRGRHLLQVISVGRILNISPTYHGQILTVPTIRQHAILRRRAGCFTHFDKCQVSSFVLPASSLRRPIRQRQRIVHVALRLLRAIRPHSIHAYSHSFLQQIPRHAILCHLPFSKVYLA